MTQLSYRKIARAYDVDAEITLPPSKSYTNRALITGALARGNSTILNPSLSDDSHLLISALREFGISIKPSSSGVSIEGSGGKFQAPSDEIDVGNAGTAMRFLTGFAALGSGTTRITGDARMLRRPIRDLVECICRMGVRAESTNGYPPVTVHGGTLRGGIVDIDATKSSQFLSSILLVAPYATSRLEIQTMGTPSSLPYLDITLDVMKKFGAVVQNNHYRTFEIDCGKQYMGTEYRVEPDASSAAYFLCAAAITGGTIRVPHLHRDSLQGDIRLLQVLEAMGCAVRSDSHSVEIHGGRLSGIDIDMNDMPDCVPALAVTAAFAVGQTTISRISHLRYKESDRLQAIAAELTRMGAQVQVGGDSLTIVPGRMHGARINTYNDHRIAMSFAVAGLKIDGVEISNPDCVSKSFPGFWDEFHKLESKEISHAR